MLSLGVTAAAHQLVIGIGPEPATAPEIARVDLWIAPDRIAELWRQRLLPFAENLRLDRRAPRRMVPALVGPDPSWPIQARRLTARLVRVLGTGALRIDHIGSTSVPGLPAKELIDLQVVVADLAAADLVSRGGPQAGFVRVPGRWFGLDRTGGRFEEVVLVDADPGRRP